MKALRIPNTEHLKFTCGPVDYADLFIEPLVPSFAARELDSLSDLPDDERDAATQAIHRRMHDEIEFLVYHVFPKHQGHTDAEQISIYSESIAGEPIGRVSLTYLQTEHPTIEIRVLQEKQNQGYGYEMLSAIIKAAFEQYEMDHLEYDLLRANIPSRKLVQKLNSKMVYGDSIREMYEIYPKK